MLNIAAMKIETEKASKTLIENPNNFPKPQKNPKDKIKTEEKYKNLNIYLTMILSPCFVIISWRKK